MGRALLIGSIVLVASCQMDGTPPVSAPPGAPPAPAPAPVAPAPVAIAADACPVAVTVALHGSGSSRTIVVHAENLTGAPQELVIPDRCPDDGVVLTGLPAGYDYYGTCTAGACPGDLPPKRIGLGGGERRELASTSIELGQGTCNAPLPPGEYLIGAEVPGVAPGCVAGARLVVDAPPTPKQQPDPAKPAKTSGIDVHACSADADCIVFCPDVAGCCGDSCGCKTAINKAHKDAYTGHVAATCQKAPDCPAMGCAYEPHHFAQCVNGRCRSSGGLGGF